MGRDLRVRAISPSTTEQSAKHMQKQPLGSSLTVVIWLTLLVFENMVHRSLGWVSLDLASRVLVSEG